MKSRKRAQRHATIAAILALDPAARAAAERRILQAIVDLPSFQRSRTVLLYANAFPEEIHVGPLIERALADSKRLICPRVERQPRGLILHEIRDPRRDFAPGTLGIPEPRIECPVVAPEAVDWALVPGVAFDVRCNRLGRGGGHYDRLLPQLRDDVETWAAAFDAQVFDSLPVEPHDVRVFGIVTETRTIHRESDNS